MPGHKQPFFVTGSGRTGSTFLYRLLADHPRIALTNEGHVADFLYFCLEYAGLPQKTPGQFALYKDVTLHGVIGESCIGTFTPIFLKHAKQMLAEFYAEHFKHKDFTCWGDKLPWPKTASALQTHYPESRFIILIRDPRAICASLLKYRERDLPSSPLLKAQTVAEWARYWQTSYSGLLRYLNQQVVVRYEDLVTDTLSELTRILDFLDLDGAELLLEQARQRDTFTEHATAKSPEASIDQWRELLSNENLETIESICHELMIAQGYQPTG